MRRYLWPTLFVLILLTPLVLRWAIGVSSAPLPADDEKRLRLVVISAHGESIRTEFADAFDAWHRAKYGQGVLVDYRIYGGATDIVRYFESAQRTLFAKLGTYQIDVVWGGGDDLFDRRLKAPGYLQGVKLPDAVMNAAYAQREISGLPLYDQASDPPQWFGTALSSFGIVYNKDVLRHLGLPEPTTWSDLRDPRYRGWIVLADPMRSAVARSSFMIIVERAMQDAVDAGHSADEGWANGMGTIRQIAANARLFTDSGSVVPAIVGTGDVAAGMAIDFQARAQVDAVQEGNTSRLGYIEPAGATAINPDPVATVKGAEHPEVAERFIEFLLSEEGQRLWNTRAGAPGGPKRTSLRRLPVMKSVYDRPTDFTDPVNPYLTSRNFNTSRSRTASSVILGELIQMSCIDLLDELRETRAAIFASSRAAELDRELGKFPFDQREALARAAKWFKATPLERIEMQRNWTNDFREEYRRLRAAAQAAN